MPKTRTLYRPVSYHDMLKILATDATRLPENDEPLSLTEDAAEAHQQAQDLSEAPAQGDAAYVIACDLKRAFVDACEELKLTTEAINDNLVGKIRLEAAYYGEDYAGEGAIYRGLYALHINQRQKLYEAIIDDADDIRLNFAYWATHDMDTELTTRQEHQFLRLLARLWREQYPDEKLVGSEDFA